MPTIGTETGFLETVIRLERSVTQNLNRDARESLDANHLLIWNNGFVSCSELSAWWIVVVDVEVQGWDLNAMVARSAIERLLRLQKLWKFKTICENGVKDGTLDWFKLGVDVQNISQIPLDEWIVESTNEGEEISPMSFVYRNNFQSRTIQSHRGRPRTHYLVIGTANRLPMLSSPLPKSQSLTERHRPFKSFTFKQNWYVQWAYQDP
jgi:hypothetical protein